MRRTPEEKLHDLCANRRREIAEEGFRYFAAHYELEREARELKHDAAGRQQRPQATLAATIQDAALRRPGSAHGRNSRPLIGHVFSCN